jgi:ribosomal protein S18 acetylase RimI-like enzyme
MPYLSSFQDCKVSECEPTDLVEVARLVNAAYRGEGGKAGWTSEAELIGGQRTSAEALREELAGSSDVSISLLRDANELLACVRLERTIGSGGERVLNIGMLAVRPRAQGSGIGRALLNHAEAAAYADGTRVARMTVVSIREELIAWYERRGYRRTGETQRFPYEDARFGSPVRPDLEFAVLEKTLCADATC